jgi:predicted deacetylase
VTRQVLAVCLHDVESQTIARCRLIRHWLLNRGIDHVTLLAIPSAGGRDLRPDDTCATWLRERTGAGDAVAQHGMRHRRRERAGHARDWVANRQGGAAAEFVGLTPQQTVAAIDGGRALLHAAGLQPRGFVAPAYAYTSALRRELRRRFDWYGGLLALHARRPVHAPAHGLGSSTAFKRSTSPAVFRVSARFPARMLRIDVHPADFDLPRHVAALDAVLRRSSRRQPITYDDLTS